MMDNEFDRRYASTLIEQIDFSGKHVLEVGFGNGWLIDAKWRQVQAMTAIESSADLVANAQARWAETPVAGKVSFLHGDIAAMVLPKNLYDAVVFSHSF